MAVSMDLRVRLVRAYKNGEGSLRVLAERFDVGRSSAFRWVKADRETGSCAPSSGPRGPKPKIDEAGLVVLEAVLRSHPDATNAELVDLLREQGGVETSTSGVSRGLARLGWTRKKNAVRR